MLFEIPIKWRIFQFLITKINNFKYSDRLFKHLFKRDVFFIQIGANDGKSQDPIYKYSKNWSGILIEPVYPTFVKLKENYSHCSQNKVFENIAISDYDGELMLNVPADSNTEWHDRIVSVRKENDIINDLETIPLAVPCLSLASLIRKYNVPKIDLLVMDVEGYELTILDAYDFAILPRYIYLETRFYNYSQLIGFYDRMLKLGYSIFPEKDNALLVLKK